MEPYEIGFQPSVEKDLRKLSVENCDRIMARIEALANEPFPTQVVKLKGTEGVYRIRVGDYCIIYEVEPESKLYFDSLRPSLSRCVSGFLKVHRLKP